MRDVRVLRLLRRARSRCVYCVLYSRGRVCGCAGAERSGRVQRRGVAQVPWSTGYRAPWRERCCLRDVQYGRGRCRCGSGYIRGRLRCAEPSRADYRAAPVWRGAGLGPSAAAAAACVRASGWDREVPSSRPRAGFSLAVVVVPEVCLLFLLRATPPLGEDGRSTRPRHLLYCRTLNYIGADDFVLCWTGSLSQ